MTTSVRTPAVPQRISPPSWPGWVSFAGRLVLAAVLGYAALTKIGDPAATVRAVRAYHILPESLAVPFGHALPWVELTVAALLLVGFGIRIAGAAATVLMAVFVGGIVSASARGLQIDCGCFGGGGVTAHPHYAGEIIRDLLLLAIAVGVTVIAGSRLSLDPERPAAVPPAGEGRDAARQHKVAVNRYEADQSQVVRRLRANTAIAAGLIAVMAVIGMSIGHSSAAGALVVPTSATSSGGILVGSSSAPVHLIAYEDPQCPICGEFEKASGTTLAQAVAAGKVSVEYRMMSFLGPESVRAVAALGAAAEEGKFAELRASLFAHQPKERTGGFTVSDLIGLGAGVGLTDAAYTNAVTHQTYAPWARSVEDQASKDGVTGTPTIKLNSKAIDPKVLFDPTAFGALLGKG